MTQKTFRLAGALALSAVVVALWPALSATGAESEPAVVRVVPEPTETQGPVTKLPLPRFVSLRAETGNARRGPSMDQKVDWTFNHRGLPLEITAEYGQWRRVRDRDGAGGWVHHMLLSGVRTVIVTADEPVSLLAEPDERARTRAVAEPGVIAKVEACEGAWCEVETGGIEGWLPRDAVWGVGADETIE